MLGLLRRFAIAFAVVAAMPSISLAQTVDRVDGEVRRVNEAEGKVTLRHGPLPNLDMPAMTMVFTARDPSILKDIKVGDKVNFVTENSNGVFYVLEIVKPK
jgi:Cu(I)/Ag(I) efflux system protein CusF